MLRDLFKVETPYCDPFLADPSNPRIGRYNVYRSVWVSQGVEMQFPPFVFGGDRPTIIPCHIANDFQLNADCAQGHANRLGKPVEFTITLRCVAMPEEVGDAS